MNLPADGNAAKLTGMQYADSNYPGAIPPGRVSKAPLPDRRSKPRQPARPVGHPHDLYLGVMAPRPGAAGTAFAPRPATRPRAHLYTGHDRLVSVRSASAARWGQRRRHAGRHPAACKGPCGSSRCPRRWPWSSTDELHERRRHDHARNAADSVRKLYNLGAHGPRVGPQPGPHHAEHLRRAEGAGVGRAERVVADHPPPVGFGVDGALHRELPARVFASSRPWPRRSLVTPTRARAPTSRTPSRWRPTS
jgi:hypothetical protein